MLLRQCSFNESNLHCYLKVINVQCAVRNLILRVLVHYLPLPLTGNENAIPFLFIKRIVEMLIAI